MSNIRQFIILGILGLLTCLGVCGGIVGIAHYVLDELPAQNELDTIAEHYQSGMKDESRAELIRYVKEHPDDDIAWTLLGHMYHEIDAYDEAKDSYLKAIAINPNAYQAYTNLGVLARDQGDTEQGIAYYTKALEINPDYAKAYTSLAVIALERHEYAKALELGEKAYRADNEDALVAANLAVIYHYNHRFDERDQMFARAQELGYDKLAQLQRIFTHDMRVLETNTD